MTIQQHVREILVLVAHMGSRSDEGIDLCKTYECERK